MFSREFDFFLAGAALIIGIMMLTGHGNFFLKGGNADLRKRNTTKPNYQRLQELR